MVGTKKRWMTALLVLVLAVCLSALCWFVLPTKNINAADGSGSETTTEQPVAGESQSAEALQQAIDAAADGETVQVQMTSDVTGNITIADGKNIVLDLNGYTLTGEGNHTIVNNGTLTITDGSATKSGAVDNVTHAKGALVNNGTAILDGGTFKRSAEAGVSATNNGGNSWYVIDNHGTLTINDGVAVYHGAGAETAAQWKYSSLIRNIGTSAEATATLTVNGGEFNTGLIALKNDDFGMLEVNGGKISSGNQAVQNWYKATVDGGTFDGRVITWFYSDNTGAADMTISNGTFSGQVKSVDFEAGADGVYPLVSDGTTISGGNFTQAFDGAYLASDAVLYPTEDGTFAVADQATAEQETIGVAQIGQVIYETLAEAVCSTGTGDVDATVITIIGEGNVVNGAGVVIEGQNVIIDLNGKTYNVINPTVGSPGTETNAFQMLKGSKVVFRNGALTSGVAKILLQNYCDLTLENVTIDATGSSSIQYIASNNNGSFTAVGNTQLIADEGQVAFDVYYGMSANYDDGVKVTFGEDFTGKVVGKVEYSAASRVTDGTWQDKAVVTIENGEFDIAINLVDNESATDANINISGGTFGEIPNYNYFADGYIWTDNGDGTYGVEQSEETFVAVINGIGYTSLLAAMEAAPEGATITLIDEVVIDTEVTLDLSGYVIVIDETFPSDTYDVAIRVIEGGALTITGDGVIDAKLADDNLVPVAAMRANSSIIMNGGTIIVDTPSESCLFAMGGSITINGGTLENLCEDEYSYGGGRTQVVNISNGTPGELVINGGTFIGRNPALGDDNLGGTFIAEDAKLAQSTDENGNVVYKALGQDETVAGVDAVYYVENDLAVAEVYTAAGLADALAATTGAVKNPAYDVIRLGDDISGNIVVDKGRTLTIDLNGFTLTGADNHTIINNGTLVITDSSEAKSGAVDNVTHAKGALVNNGTAILNGGTFKRSAEAGVSATDNGGNSWYVIENHGKLTINDGVAVYHGTSAEMAAQWKHSSLIRNVGTSADATATLTVNGGEFNTGLIALKNDDYGTLTVNGGQISSGNQAVQNWYKAAVNGGTFNGQVITWFYGSNIGAAAMTINDGIFNAQVKSVDYDAGADGVYPMVDEGTAISGGKFAVMPNEAYFIEGLTGALVDGYYVTVKATSPVEELRPAIFEAQAAVRSYAAALGINWADIASARAADAQAVLAAYDAIESAASVDLVLVAQLNAMDALDEYAAALAAELDAYKAEKIAALETLAGDGYVPAYAIAAINGAASVAEVDACYNAAVAEINAADDGDGISLTGVYVMLGVILVVAVAALMILLLKKQKQAEAAEAKAAAPLDRQLAEVKQAVEADETAAAVSDAAEDDDKEQIVIEANVRTFDEAYGELDEEQKKLFNDVKDYALTKEGAALTELSSGVCVKKGSKQIVKLTVRRGNPVALFVIENEMIKDFRRNSDAPVKLKVKATELVLRSGGDLEAAKAMVDVAVDQIEKDILAAKERRREARRLRRQRKREQKRQ